MAIFVADGEMGYLAVNDFACELLGYTRDELLALRVTDVAEAPSADAMYAEMIDVGAQEGLTPLRTKDGSTVIVRYLARTITVDGVDVYISWARPRRVLPAGTTAQEAAARGPRARGSDLPTAREIEILELLAEGLENDEIARRLFLSPDTVKSHIRRLTQKLGARSRTHAVAIALRRGLLD